MGIPIVNLNILNRNLASEITKLFKNFMKIVKNLMFKF